ncbi:DUF3887 domain-containing protein [Pedobacter sp. Leaf250]|uniref:DUF3887 domain-containing protein n=1 Tax=Pedobacter sp. Leaf250 TaxID=2876559 RepID=UPI001E4F096B|nr:DUF3887 domain-containing protein [Pedobacter sp. Leaf250]
MKNKLFSVLFAFCLLLTLISCNFSGTYINREEDKKDAEKVADEFYTLLQNNEFQKVNSLLSTQFKAATSAEKLNNYLSGALNKLGEIKSKKLDHWESKVVKGTQSSATYVFHYLVERTKFQSKETVTLTAENDKIKIQCYNINSDGLLLAK